MTLTTGMIAAGSALAVLGLLMLGYCIMRALAIRRNGEAETATQEMRTLVAINMAGVGIAFIGLGLVLVGVIL